MTNVSKKLLNKKTHKQLFVQLTLLFEAADDKKIASLFEALFTESEKVMFMKRIAIVLLISENYSNYAIVKTLHVSGATVRNIKKQAQSGKFNPLIGITRKKSFDKKRFWETVEVLSRGGLPPMGKDRWKWLDKHFEK